MEMALIWRTFAGLAGSAAISALWQGTVVALGLALCLRLTPRISAGDRFKVWAAGFTVLALLPFLHGLFSFVHSFFRADSVSPVGTVPAVAAPHAGWYLDPRWSVAIAAVWIAASLARAVDLGVHTLRLQRLWKRATPVAGAIFAISKIEVCTTCDLDRPSVIGFFAPRILIPEWLLERLSGSELEQVVLHEAEHLRRHDDWLNLAQKLSLLVFPLNPALAWMERRLCREREMACDEGVVRRTQAPRTYAACLASLAERRFEREHGLESGLDRRAAALTLGAWQRRPELVERVHRVLRRSPGLHPATARALIGVVGCGLVLGSVELARCPQVVTFAARPIAGPAVAADGKAVVDGRSMSPYRAIDAVVHVPSRAQLTEARMAQQRRSMAQQRARRSNTLAMAKNSAHEARIILAQTDATAKVHGPVVAQPQQWIVFTAWEQLETTNSVASRAEDRSADSAPQIVAQYTMTQLILRVDPAARPGKTPPGSDGNSTISTSGTPANRGAANSGAVGSGATSTAAAIRIFAFPAAIPIRGQSPRGQVFVRGVTDGWLVIQL